MALERRCFNVLAQELDLWIIYHETIWFRSNELVNFLGYADVNRTMRTTVFRSHKKSLATIQAMAPGIVVPRNWPPRTLFINESGLHKLVHSSTYPRIEQLQNWISNILMPRPFVQTFSTQTNIPGLI